MSIPESIDALKAFAKYERGRGRKYPLVGCPVEREQICEAISIAIKYLKAISSASK